MTTAPAELPPEMRVVAAIRALRASKQMRTDDVRRHIGVSRTTWFERMQKGNFSIGEIIAIADLFDVTVQSLVDGKVTLPCPAPFLEVVASRPGHSSSHKPNSVTQPALMRGLPTLN